MDDLKSIVDYFNDYFVGVGTDVGSKIKVPGDKTDSFNNLITVNSKSMFLCWVNDTDLIEIVRKKQKRSTDINSIDMVIIKDVWFCGKTSDYICNLL